MDHITDAAIADSATRLVPPNSVAVVVRSGILERTIPVALVPFATTLNQDMKALACRPDVDPRWVAWGLRAHERELLRTARKAGTTVASLEWGRFLEWRLPIPQLAEQKRVLEILEDHLSRLDAANSYLDAAAKRARHLERAALDQIVWAPGWPTVPLRSILREPMRNGFSARASADGATRVLTLTAVTRRAFTDEYTKLTDAAPDRVRGLWLERGDIFVQRANTPELVGSSALYTGPSNWAIFPDLLIRLRADESAISPEYLALALRTERCHRTLRARAKGLAGSMPKVDQAAIGDLPVPRPALDDQAHAVAAADDRLAALSSLITSSDSAARRASGLRRALLAAAFSGRLTGSSSDLELAEETAFA